uniref:Uncharacterized protein n=1 Tax=Heterorhabditis bacteriophora TaxID=37862 RepID=A0A1I7WMK4_HETBA
MERREPTVTTVPVLSSDAGVQANIHLTTIPSPSKVPVNNFPQFNYHFMLFTFLYRPLQQPLPLMEPLLTPIAPNILQQLKETNLTKVVGVQDKLMICCHQRDCIL